MFPTSRRLGLMLIVLRSCYSDFPCKSCLNSAISIITHLLQLILACCAFENGPANGKGELFTAYLSESYCRSIQPFHRKGYSIDADNLPPSSDHVGDHGIEIPNGRYLA
ncbi:hypothetical protein B0H34DRAFT_542802 [Crassisporium funariophilum]|nr:hypothetical protein B0H34DRAFT_542802 [Crassisporium funariophilum]